MTTSPATQATPDAARARRGMWATLLLAVAFLAFSFFTVPEVVTAADWRDRVANSIPPALGLLALVSAGLIWRGRVNLGAWLLLISLWAGFSVVPALVGGYGLVTGVLAVLVPAAIATLALPPRQVGRVILIGVLAAYLMLFVDAYYPGQRMASDADDRAAAQWITLAVLVIYGLVMARQFPSFSLRSKLIIGAVAVSIVSIIAVTLVSIQASRANVFDAAGAGLKNLATSRARALGDLLVNQVEALEALGLGRTLRDRVESISDSYTGDPVAREALLLDLDARWRAAGDDDQLIASRLSNDTAVQLREYSRTFPDHVEVFVTDKYGGLVAASGRTSDYYQADEHWWLAAYNDGAGATFIGQPEFDASAGAFAVNIALPVRDRDTTDIVGVLRTTFAMRALNALMSDIAGGQADIDLYLSVNDRLETESGTIVANDLAPEQLAQALQTTYILAVTEGEASLVASAPIEASGGAAYVRNLGWRAVARLPEAPATAGLEAQVNNAILLGAVIAGLAALGAFLVSLSLAGPIQALSAAAEKFAAGDLSARAIVRTRDELGALAATVNTMAGQLHTTLGGLEARVAERTRDLALAADVGRSLSQVQDLDSLLTNAVELIRDRFELYYTQVYLADPTGQTLVLRAGTGDAGEELLRRQHRLPIGPGSLNGRAVAERQTIIVADTRTDPNFRPNLLLPHTRSEMSVPLLVGDRAVGVLDLQSARPGAFTPDNLAAFETLGGQVAIAIQNANLFAEAVQARAEIEAQTKRLVQSGWEDFLNAVERKERLTHTFVGPEPAASRESAELRPLSAPIMVSNQAIGQLTLEADRPWTEDEAGVVQLVARQVAQQVENLRLLAQAGRAQAEALAATRRLTREAWQDYLSFTNEGEAYYAYDQNQVTNLPPEAVTAEPQAAYPLQVRDETIGVLEVVRDQALDLDDRELLAAVAAQLSAHVENLRLVDDAERSRLQVASFAARLQQMQDIGRAVARELEPGAEVYRTALAGMARLLSARLAALDLRDDFGNQQLFVHVGDDEAAVQRLGDLPAVKSLLYEGLPVRLTTIPDEPEHTGLLGLPLIFQDRVLGRLFFVDHPAGEFVADDETLAASFADSLAGSVQAARLLQRIRNRARELETVANVGTAASTILEADRLLQTVVDLTKARFNLYHAHIYLTSGDGQALKLAAGAGEVGRQLTAEGRLIPLSSERSLVAQAARSRRAVIVNDVRQDPHFLPNPLLPDTASEMSVPLMVGEQVLGVLDVQSDQPNRFTHEDISIQSTLASQVAVALQNARSFAAEQRRAEREQLVNAITQDIQRATTVPGALQTALERLGQALKARRATIELGGNGEPKN